TGQKSLSKASRLENICIPPGPQDAMQVSNVRLTTATGHNPREPEQNSRIRQPQAAMSAITKVQADFAADRALNH
ncbi:MAG TPA: hypothetical protein VFI51_06265, partial [Bradyrhizobium sp.]|nr:hypothetical protein [Bradyrhizobium sp.]